MSIWNDTDADVLKNSRNTLASTIYYAVKESTTSEQRAQMTAVDNGSQNASDIISKLTLTLNHTLQAVFTRSWLKHLHTEGLD